MNADKLRRNEWTRVRIRPQAKRFLGRNGPELPQIDDTWTLKTVIGGEANIENNRTHHVCALPMDHIHHFSTDPERGKGNGFLVLTSQINIGGDDLWIEPGLRPTSS